MKRTEKNGNTQINIGLKNSASKIDVGISQVRALKGQGGVEGPSSRGRFFGTLRQSVICFV